MAIAIETRYIGPTNFRGSRVKAIYLDQYGRDTYGAVTLPYDRAKCPTDTHKAAVRALLAKSSIDPDTMEMHCGSTDRGLVAVVRVKY